MNAINLKGKLALITGTSKGFGRIMACALAEAGADVALVSRNVEQMEETARMTRSFGVKTFTHPADVTSEPDVARLAEWAANEFGPPHILINNAGVILRKPLVEITSAEWRRVIDTNLTSVFLMCRHFVPRMKGREYGRIIMLTSTLSHVGIAGRTAYCASKFGVLGLIRALALELAPEHITVNGISPGPYATELNASVIANPELNRQMLARIPMGRWGDPKDIGQLALFLCSDAASFITGTDVLLDGGWTAQ